MRTYTLVTFGCQMNQHDSDRIGEVLESQGYTRGDSPEQADLIVLNTCSVREKAEQKLRSEVGRLGMLKAKRPELLIGVAGCVAQQEGERLLARMPQIDLVVGPDRIGDLPDILADLELGAPPRVSVGFDVDEPRFLRAEPRPGKTQVTAFVTVMKGCNERCSFCIVPTTRGPERYRPAREIVDEVARLVASGVREITLLGQTVNSYRDPERSLAVVPPSGSVRFGHLEPADESEFAALLRSIVSGVPGLTRLRYTSPHPRHLTPSLIEAHRDLKVLMPHVHLPFQSGSDRVLKRMIRRYTAAEYKERVAALREAVPAVTLSTDAIVGFPGETREDFAQTLELVEAVEFIGLYGFKYSPRPGTPALKLGDDVSEEEKGARLAELFEVADAQRRAHLAAMVGRTEQVLVEGIGRGKNKEFMGRAEHSEIVHVEGGDRDPTGHVVSVRIERAYKNSLFGTLASEGPALPPRRATPEPTRSEPTRSLPVLG